MSRQPASTIADTWFRRALAPWWVPGVGVFALAFVVRLATLGVVAQPEFVFQKYPTLALEMLHGRGQALIAFTASPLYLYFWTVLHRLFPGGLAGPIVVQMALGSLTCGLIALAAAVWGGRRIGVAAGLAAAVYLPFVVNDASFVSEGLVLLCNALFLLAMGKVRQDPRAGWAALAGVALGLSGMARPNILLLWPFGVAGLWFGVSASARRRLVLIGWLLVPAAAGPLLITARNAVVSGEPVLVMADSGIVLFVGNNQLNRGLTYVWPRHEELLKNRPGEVDPTHRIAHEIAETETGRPLSARQSARFWTREALRFPLSHPFEYLSLLVRKVRYVWAAVEGHDVQTTFAQEDALRYWPFLRFGWVAPLALVGLVVTAGRWRGLIPIYGLLLTYTATGAMFTVVARYRLPMLPGVLILAVLGGEALVCRWRRGDRRGTELLALLTVAAIALVNWPDHRSRSLMANYTAAVFGVNRAADALDNGNLDLARTLYTQLEREPPTFELLIQARRALALIAWREGDHAAAAAWGAAAVGPLLPNPRLTGIPDAESLRQRLARNRHDAEAWLLLGARQWDDGLPAAAERSFRRVADLSPAFPTAYMNRGWCCLQLGKPAAARRWGEAARLLQPTLPNVHELIIAAAEAQGSLDAVAADYGHLVKAYPHLTVYQEALGAARQALRRSAAEVRQ